MRLIIKVLNGKDCVMEVSTATEVWEVKRYVEQQIDVPVSQQRLVYKGKTLSDEKRLGEYGIKDGCKLFLVVKKGKGESSTDSAAKSYKSSISFWDELNHFLLRHFTSSDAKLVLQTYKQDFNNMIDGMSLDDIERLASVNLDSTKRL